MGRKKTISVQVNAVISVTWKSDSKNPLKAFKKSARYCQDFPFCLSCPRSLAFLNALCAWGIHQTQHREAQHISILLCTSHPWGQGPVTPLSPSPIFAQHTLSSHNFLSYLSFHQETICLGMLFHLLIYMSPARQTPALILPQDNVNRINKPQWLHQSVCSSPSRTAEGALVLKYIQYSISDSSGLLLCLRDCLSAR